MKSENNNNDYKSMVQYSILFYNLCDLTKG